MSRPSTRVAEREGAAARPGTSSPTEGRKRKAAQSQHHVCTALLSAAHKRKSQIAVGMPPSPRIGGINLACGAVKSASCHASGKHSQHQHITLSSLLFASCLSSLLPASCGSHTCQHRIHLDPRGTDVHTHDMCAAHIAPRCSSRLFDSAEQLHFRPVQELANTNKLVKTGLSRPRVQRRAGGGWHKNTLFFLHEAIPARSLNSSKAKHSKQNIQSTSLVS